MIVHLTIAVRGRKALARTESERRAVVRMLARLAGDSLLLFNVVDDHLHLVVRARQPGRLGRSVGLGLGGLRPELRLKRAHPELVDSRSYLRFLVRYVYQQSGEKGLGPDATWSGSSFQDLVGARRLPGLDRLALFEELPRLRMREVFPLVGLKPRPLEPREAAASDGIERLTRASAAACCVAPELPGRSAPVLRAVSVALALALEAGLSSAEVRRGLRRSRSALSRLRRHRPDPRDLIAARLRLALEDRS